MQEYILVSCWVVCYNSAATVVETLESIKSQTYQNIELIVSDDCSKDDTINICRDWLDNNKERFIRTELLTVDKNTGVAGNCNRAIQACHGIWLKGCAADDALLPNCVEDYVNFVIIKSEARWVASEIRRYKETFEEKNCLSRHYVSTRDLYDLAVEDQIIRISKENTIPAMSLFCQLSLINEIGGYDTTYSFEDYPFNITVLEKGYKCYFMDKETVAYRFHDSASQSANQLFHTGLLSECRRFQRERCFVHLSKKQTKGILLQWKVQDILIKLHLNKRIPFISHMYYLTLKIISTIYNL